MVRFYVLAVTVGLIAGKAMAADIALKLPREYKTKFDNYLITDRLGQEDQVMSLFANDVAREGVSANGKLPYGSIIVGEIYAAKKDAKGNVIESELGRRVPAKLKAIVMMERRKGWDKQYPKDLKVGDWEFEVFSPAGKNLGKKTTACRQCHHPLTESEFTFSYAHIGGAN